MKQQPRELLEDVGISIMVMCGLAALVITAFVPIAAIPFHATYVIIGKCIVILGGFTWAALSIRRS
jgi:hypothetical protein